MHLTFKKITAIKCITYYQNWFSVFVIHLPLRYYEKNISSPSDTLSLNLKAVTHYPQDLVKVI